MVSEYYNNAVLKVFKQLGELIEQDEKNKTSINDMPSEIMEKISSYLLNNPNSKTYFEQHDKRFEMIFHDKTSKNDDELLKFLFNGKIPDIEITDIYNREFHNSEKELECIKIHINKTKKFLNIKCDKLKIMYKVNNAKQYNGLRIQMYDENNKFIGNITDDHKVLWKHNGISKKEFLCTKECQEAINNLIEKITERNITKFTSTFMSGYINKLFEHNNYDKVAYFITDSNKPNEFEILDKYYKIIASINKDDNYKLQIYNEAKTIINIRNKNIEKSLIELRWTIMENNKPNPKDRLD